MCENINDTCCDEEIELTAMMLASSLMRSEREFKHLSDSYYEDMRIKISEKIYKLLKNGDKLSKHNIYYGL